MALNEKVFWRVLCLMHGNSASWKMKLLGEPAITQAIEKENAIGVGALKKRVVLEYLPDDIEDTIYFLKHRGYLQIHGFGIANPEIVYSLSEKAIQVFHQKQLPEEEQTAFQESILEGRPSIYGVGLNLREIWKRIRRVARKIQY